MKLTLIVCVLLFASCNNEPHEGNGVRPETRGRAIVEDVIMDAGSDEFNKGKAKAGSSPIVVKSVTINSERVTVTYKNVSDKPIDAVRFSIHGKNNWGEPEKITHVGSAYSICESQDEISPGKTLTKSWGVQTGEPTKAECAVTKVHFVDGNVWNIENINNSTP